MGAPVFTPGHVNSVLVFFSFWACQSSSVLFCRQGLALEYSCVSPSQTDVCETEQQSKCTTEACPSPLTEQAHNRGH